MRKYFANPPKSPDEKKVEVFVGMLGDWKVEPHPSGSRMCLSTDELGRFIFTFKKQNGKLFKSSMKSKNWVSDGNSCAEVLARHQ